MHCKPQHIPFGSNLHGLVVATFNLNSNTGQLSMTHFRDRCDGKPKSQMWVT